MFYKSKTCKLWFKKLAVYTLCALLINQQLFSLSASLRQIAIDFNDNQPGHALFDNPLFRVEAHLKNVDQLVSPESSGYASEDSEYDGGDTSLTLFESDIDFDRSINTEKSYHEFGGATKINSSDKGVDFKLKDGPDHYLSLTWFQNQLTIHKAETRGFQLAINFNGTVVFEGGENLGSIILNGQETIISGRTSITDLELTTATLQNGGELNVYGTADLNLTTLRQSETARLMARQMNLEVHNLQNAGDISAGEHLHLIKKAGTYSNTGTIGSHQSAELDFLALKQQDKLGKLVAPEMVLAPLQGGHSPTINHAQIFAEKSIVIKSSTFAPFLILHSEITTPHLFTTATGIFSANNTLNIDRLRVELGPRHHFKLGDLAMAGILEFAEPGVDLDSAKAKAEFEALYAPVTTPFEHDHAFKVDIQGSLTAYGMRVFGQKILVNVGTQPLKYDEPGYDHTIGSTAGMIDLRQGDGELDIYAHSFDLQKGHVLAKNGAIRAPNLVHLGRLVRDPGSDVFATFYRHKQDGFEHNLGTNIFEPSFTWDDIDLANPYDGRHLLRMPFFIRNQSGVNIKENLILQGALHHQGDLRSNHIILILTKASDVENGKILTKRLCLSNYQLSLRPSVANFKHKYYEYEAFWELYPHRDGFYKARPGEQIIRTIRFTKYGCMYCTIKRILSDQEKAFTLSNSSSLRTQSIDFVNEANILVNGSIFTSQSAGLQQKISSIDVKTSLFQKRISGSLEFRNKIANQIVTSTPTKPRRCHTRLDPLWALGPDSEALVHDRRPVASRFDQGGVDLRYPASFLSQTDNFDGAQNLFPAQTSIGSDVVLNTPESLEGSWAVAGHVLVLQGRNPLVIGIRNPYHMPPQPPVSVLDMSTAFDGIYVTLNPKIDQQLRQKVPFTFFIQDAWFQQPEAQKFYEDMACPLIVHGSDGTFKRHIGPATIAASPSLLIEFVQKEVSKKLRRGFVYPNQPIDEEFIKQLHRQAAQYYTQYFHQGDPVTERSLSTLFSRTDTSSIHPFMFYEPQPVANQSAPLLKPGLFIPPHLIAEVSSQRGPPVYITGDIVTLPKGLPLHQSLAITDGNPDMQRSIIAAAAHDSAPSEPGAMIPAAERQRSGDLEINNLTAKGNAAIFTDGNINASGHIQAASIHILSISGNVDLNAEVRRHPTWNGFIETVLSRPFLEAMGNITVAAPSSTVTLTAAHLLSETGIVRIGAKDINIRSALAHYYYSAQNRRVQGTRATVSHIEGEGIVAEAERTLTTAGVETLSRSGDTVLQGGQVLQRGTYNTQTTEIWGKKRKGGLSGAFGGKKTTYNRASTYTAIPDRNDTTAGSVRVVSRSAPAQIHGGIVTIPAGQLYDVRSVPGARLYALHDWHETISRTTSSSMLRTVIQGSQTLTRIPRPVTVQGGGRFRFVPLPLPMGETSNLPALTVETFVRPENNHLSSLVVAKNALPGLEDIVAQYPDQVRITPVSLTHHESHYKVVALSPVLGVSVGIAVACLTHGTGAGLLGVTAPTSKFFASAVFSAVAGNLANGAASQAVGDRNGLRNAFSEQAVKGMATSIIGQYIGGQLAGADGFDIASKASLENMSHLLGRVAIDTTVQTTLRTVVMQENLNKAFAGALRSAAVQQIGRAVATDIGEARADGGLGYMPHKLLHGITGAITGALWNPDDPLAGAAAGGFGAAVAEVIGEAMAPDLEEQATEIKKLVKEKEATISHPLSDAERRKIRQEAFTEYNDTLTNNIQFKSRLLTVAASAIAGVDPKISDSAAQTAVENNLIQFLIIGGFAAWAIYDTYTVYDDAIKAGKSQEDAIKATIRHLGYEIIIAGVGAKFAVTGARIVAPTARVAWTYMMSKNPGLKLFMQKMGIKVAHAAEAVGSKVGRFDQAADSFLTRHWTKATGRAASGEAAAAGGGAAPLSLVGLSTSEQQVAKVLNQQLTHMPEMAGLMTESTLSRVIKDIGLKPGQTYQASYLRNQTLGWIAEQRGMKVLERAGYQVVESKLPGNKGFDAVGIRRTAAGEIQDIMIVESKFSADGTVKLARYKNADNLPYTQMSDEWMRSVLDRMSRSKNPDVRQLEKIISRNEKIVNRKLNVVNLEGQTKWVSDKLPISETYK